MSRKSDPLRELFEDLARAEGLELEPGPPDDVLARVPGCPGQARISLASIRRLSVRADSASIERWAQERIQATARALRSRADSESGVLLPMLRPPAEPGSPQWARVLAQGRLSFILVRDQGTQLKVMTPMDIVQHPTGLKHLTSQALGELTARSCGSQLQTHPELDCLEYILRDGFTAARALIAHRLIADPLGTLLLLPSRDHLWVLPARRPSALATALTLREAAIRVAQESPYPISAEVFWQRDGTLQHLPVVRDPSGLAFASPPIELCPVSEH